MSSREEDGSQTDASSIVGGMCTGDKWRYAPSRGIWSLRGRLSVLETIVWPRLRVRILSFASIVAYSRVSLHEWIPGHVVKVNSMLDERTYHSRYFGKSRSICHTLSLGASIKMDAETENTPLEDGGGMFEDVDML